MADGIRSLTVLPNVAARNGQLHLNRGCHLKRAVESCFQRRLWRMSPVLKGAASLPTEIVAIRARYKRNRPSDFELRVRNWPAVIKSLRYGLGKVAEWFKATVLKTVVGPVLTVSSNLTLSARSRNGGGAGVDDRSRLLSGCSPNKWTQGSNPCLPVTEGALANSQALFLFLLRPLPPAYAKTRMSMLPGECPFRGERLGQPGRKLDPMEANVLQQPQRPFVIRPSRPGHIARRPTR